MEMNSKKDKEGTIDTEEKQPTTEQSTPTTGQDKTSWSPFALLSSILCVNFRDVGPFKAYNFVVYGAFGCLLPYMPLYFKQLGLSATQTGILIGVRPLSIAIGAPLWGILSDKYKKRRLIIIAAVLCIVIKHLLIMPVQPKNAVCLKHYENETTSSSIVKDYMKLGNAIKDERKQYTRFQKTPRAAPSEGGKQMGDGRLTKESRTSHFMLASQTMSENSDFSEQQKELRQLAEPTTANNQTLTYELWVDGKEMARIFVILLFIVIISEILGSAGYSVVDACIVDNLGDERASYGRVRLWGSVGIATATLIVGAVIHGTGFQKVCGQERKDYFIAFYFFFGFMTLGLVSSFFMKIVYREQPEAFLSKGVKLLFNSVQKSSFWLVTLFLGLLDGFQMDFTSWFLDDLGASSLLVGLAATLHFCINVVSFFVSMHLLKGIGYANTITLGLFLYAVLFVCLSLTRNAWLAAVWYALLGVAFAISWSASVAYCGLISTSLGLGAVAQGNL